MPPLNFVGNYLNKRRLEQLGTTRYDEGKFAVIDIAQSEFRKTIVGILAMMFLFGGAVLQQTPWAPFSQEDILAPATAWTNPVSGIEVVIPAGWEQQIQESGADSKEYIFINKFQSQAFTLAHLKIILTPLEFEIQGIEIIEKIDQNSSFLELKTDPVFLQRSRPFWTAVGRDPINNIPAQLLITPSDSGVWVITFLSVNKRLDSVYENNVFKRLIETIKFQPIAAS